MEGTQTIDSPAAPEARLLALSPDLLATVGSDGLLTLVNPAWTTLLGWDAQQLLGTPLRDVVHPEDRLVDGAACRMRCADGGERHVRWTVRDGFLAGQDVTEQARLAEDLQDFAYVASHDLAEPLRMVTAYLELLQRRYGGQLDETADEFIGYAVGGAERMKTMIDALLAFSRIGTRPLEPADFDLSEVLIDHEGIEPVESLGTVHGDPTQIAQLLHHLIDNARKFRHIDRPPVVSVSTAEEDGGVRIDVADNGIGIPEPQHERIFKMFARLHGRDEYEGTGAGLALCRRIAERHGGRITLASEPDAGSTFSVWLPR